MSFFISNALAEGAAAAPADGNPLLGLLPFIVLFVIFYFFLIRPQSKRVKEHKKMIEALGKGDEVITNGGLLGKVVEISDEFITLEVAKNIQVKVQRSFVSNVMPKGTINSAG